MVIRKAQIHVPIPCHLKPHLWLVVVGRFDAHVDAHQRRQLLGNRHGIVLTLADVVLVISLVCGDWTTLIVTFKPEVGRVRCRHRAAVRMVQAEALECLFQLGILGQAVVRHPPVGTHRCLEHVERDVFRRHAQVSRHEGGHHDVLADGSKSRRVPNLIQFVVVVQFVLTAADCSATGQEVLPNGVGVSAVVVHKRRRPAHHRGREISRLVGRLIDVVLQVFVVAEKALVILGDVSVGRQFDFEIPDGLKVGANVEILTVGLRVLVVQIGLLDEPAVGGRLLSKDPVTKPVAVQVRVLVAHQEWQSRSGEVLVESSVRRALVESRKHRPFVAGVGSTHIVEPHHKPQDVLHWVQFDFFFLLFIFDFAKPVALLVAHISA